MSDVDVVLAVVTYNSADVIGTLLDSVPAALDGARAHTVVVDNGSSDDTVALVSARSDCTLVRAPNLGYAAGINRAVRESDAPGAPVLALNPDLVLHPGSVRELLAALDRGAGEIIAPQVQYPDGAMQHSLRREPTIARTLGLNFTGLPGLSEYVNRTEEYVPGRVADWALGAALLMDREGYDRLGGWDESFFLYSEETDFCLRARDIGLRTVYEPQAVVTHIGGGSGQSGWTHSMQMVNRVRLYRRRHGPVRSWVFLLMTALREATWLTRRRELALAGLGAMFRPSLRPAELGCSDRVMPR